MSPKDHTESRLCDQLVFGLLFPLHDVWDSGLRYEIQLTTLTSVGTVGDAGGADPLWVLPRLTQLKSRVRTRSFLWTDGERRACMYVL